MPADGRIVVYVLNGSSLPSADPRDAAQTLGLETGAADHVPIARPLPGLREVAVADLPVWAVPLRDALPALLALPLHPENVPGWRRPPASAVVWALAARLGVRRVAAHHLAPALTTGPDDQVHGVWRALVDDDAEAGGLVARLAAAMPRAGHAVVLTAGDADAARSDQPAIWQPAALIRALLDAVADLAARDGGPPPPAGRPRARLLPWTARWSEALADPVDSVVPLREDAAELVASVAGWHTGGGEDGGGGTTELQLVAPEAQDGSWRLDFGVRTPDGELRPASEVWAASDADADAAILQETLLRGLGRCARVFAPIDAALKEAAPEHLDLELDQAWELLCETAPLLAGIGVVVRLPGDLVQHRLRPRMRVGVAADERPPDLDPGAVGLDSDLAMLPGIHADGEDGGQGAFGGLLAGFRWEIALGDDTLSREEFEAILAANAPLVRWRDRWVRVDPGTAERIGTLSGPGEVTLAEALALGLEGDVGADWYTDEEDGEPVEVVADGGVALLLERIRAACDHPPAPLTPDGFVGELRGYQRRGVAWLSGMGELGLGAVLADDMGLGKTIQLIAHLLQRSAGSAEPGPFLIVCPTSVVGNWEREVRRFAPTMPVIRHHGADRRRELERPSGAVLTTYGTLRRDADLLASVEWDVVALDEAQHVKNPTTAAARAVRRLTARQVVALTGTPLENRLAELWSVLDATNPGILGSRAGFGRRFVAPIEKRRDGAAAVRLRRLVAPFVLRRSKADPAVIADLPDKIERTVVCPLTPEQAALYEAAVERTFATLADGQDDAGRPPTMERRGRILALLTELKQICNHPAQYLDEENPQLLGRSGKLAATQEIVHEATNAGDRLLLFTQFVAMGRLLAAQLSADLDVEVPFLHGGIAAGGRDRMVDRFQSDPDASPVLIVSLRAGGTGLNLTAATHVLHYDRWWNPAVEDQATDRAHRIGQTRTVEVHKLVTSGTLEERIADLLERKRALADAVVGDGETWVTELDDDALAELVALSRDAELTDLEDDEEVSVFS